MRRLTVNAALSQEHLQQAARALQQAAEDVCSPLYGASQAYCLDRNSSLSTERFYPGLDKSVQAAGQGSKQNA